MARRRRKVSVDRLSNLPEELICHILSFLPTVDAVKATLLSPKFLNLWKKITTIRFYHRSLCLLEPETKFSKFVESVSKVLSVPETRCIDEFSIKLDCPRDIYSYTISRRLSNCVTAAVAKHVKRLVIVNGDDTAPSFELPSCIFTCNSLEVLEVSNAILEMNPSMICLPNLRILHWENVRLEADNSFNRLISGCSSLHSLYLRIGPEKEYANLEVWSPTLEHLTVIVRHPGFVWPNQLFDYRLKMDTPALKYLHLELNMFTNISIKTSSSVIKPEISISWCDLRTINNFIGALSNVKFLVLDVSWNRLEPSGDSVVWPIFPNLTSLTLWISSDRFDIVKDWLLQLPRMETLELHCTYGVCNSSEESTPPIGHLEMLEYIHLNASLWKRVKIMTHSIRVWSGSDDSSDLDVSE